jgi:hypothetical protein
MLHSDAVTNDGAGSAADVDRDTMIVGVPGFDLLSKLGAGAAVIFRWRGTSWVEEARLTASDAGAGDRFGQSVAIQGNTAVVGAYLHDLPSKTNAGAVYVFQRSGTTWTQVAKLTASNSAADDNLGISVDLDGDTILAGAWLKVLFNVQQGAAYVFTRNAAGVWSQQGRAQRCRRLGLGLVRQPRRSGGRHGRDFRPRRRCDLRRPRQRAHLHPLWHIVDQAHHSGPRPRGGVGLLRAERVHAQRLGRGRRDWE